MTKQTLTYDNEIRRSLFRVLKGERLVINYLLDIRRKLYMNKIYRGHCFEFFPCGYQNTEAYKKARENYIGNINVK